MKFQCVLSIIIILIMHNLHFHSEQVCYKVIKLVKYSISPASLFGRASISDLKSQCRGFESHYGQVFFIMYFVAFDALLAGRLVPYK